MINHLKGTIEVKKDSYIVIDVNGVGYKVSMSDTSLQKLNLDEKVKIYTYLRMSEDDINLYGFLSYEELSMFELLISVGGIGSKSALKILSNIIPSKFALAVITNDVNTLKKLPGIGIKTAQRIILELKDKIKASQQEENEKEGNIMQIEGNAKDAQDALQVLGYTRKDIEDVLGKIDVNGLSVEEIIKHCLKHLS